MRSVSVSFIYLFSPLSSPDCGEVCGQGLSRHSGDHWPSSSVQTGGEMVSTKPQGSDVLLRSRDHSSEGYSQVGQP